MPPCPRAVYQVTIKLQDKGGQIPVDFEVTGYWFWEVRYGRAEEGRSLGLGITFRPVFFFFSCQVLCRIEEQQHCVPLSPGGRDL